MLIALVVVSWWVLFRKGLASATYEAFDKPGLLILVIVVTVFSAGFHEFGHAAGARRGGATPGAMGAGIYLVWPAFYTDVTDSYRLGRWGRVVTDLGGLYFNAIVAVAIGGVWWATQYDALLLVIATQILQMVRQLTPLVRFDGYHVLADVTGVPDLFQRIKPTLLGVLPWRWHHPESTVLKPWARAVVTLWVVVVVPLLLFSLFCMVLSLPRLLGTAWASLNKQSALLSPGLDRRGRARGVRARSRDARDRLPDPGHRADPGSARATAGHDGMDGDPWPTPATRRSPACWRWPWWPAWPTRGGHTRATTDPSSPTREAP